MPDERIALVAFDVDRIKDFVFATHRPVDITGASEMVKDLAKDGKLREWLNGWVRDYDRDVIYANGGSGLIQIEANGDKPKKLASYLEEVFRTRSLTGSLTAVSTVPEGNLDDPAVLQKTLKILSAELQHRKAEKAGEECPEFWTMGYFERCQACGLYPACELSEIGQEKVCDSCLEKRKRGKQARDHPRDLPPMALSLEEIVGQEGEERYLAVIYGDVNNAGDLLYEARSLDQLGTLSEHLWASVNGAVRDIVTSHHLERRYQSPVVGGDDLVLFVSARGALDSFFEVWERAETKGRAVPSSLQNTPLGDRLRTLSFSFSLLVAPHHLPIPFLFDYAQALVRNAKKLAYREEGPAGDFFWITGGTPLSEGVATLRERMLCRRYSVPKPQLPYQGTLKEVEEFWLTRTPYTKDELRELRNQAEALKQAKVTVGQLRRLVQLLELEPGEAYVNLLYQTTRTDELKQFLTTLRYTPDRWPEFFFEWKLDPRVQVKTRLLDLLELYELDRLKEG